jgi:hypothetical protein
MLTSVVVSPAPERRDLVTRPERYGIGNQTRRIDTAGAKAVDNRAAEVFRFGLKFSPRREVYRF